MANEPINAKKLVDCMLCPAYHWKRKLVKRWHNLKLNVETHRNNPICTAGYRHPKFKQDQQTPSRLTLKTEKTTFFSTFKMSPSLPIDTGIKLNGLNQSSYDTELHRSSSHSIRRKGPPLTFLLKWLTSPLYPLNASYSYLCMMFISMPMNTLFIYLLFAYSPVNRSG